MPFLALNICRLGKRHWNLETSSQPPYLSVYRYFTCLGLVFRWLKPSSRNFTNVQMSKQRQFYFEVNTQNKFYMNFNSGWIAAFNPPSNKTNSTNYTYCAPAKLRIIGHLNFQVLAHRGQMCVQLFDRFLHLRLLLGVLQPIVRGFGWKINT